LQLDTAAPPADEFNLYSPNEKDGSQMMTIEGHDDNFLYRPEYLDADLEYHTNDDERRATNEAENATINSEEALSGTPVRKKKKKKKPKFMIENVSSADGSLDKKARYAIHNDWSEDVENDPPKSSVRGHSFKYNEMVATAKRYEDMDVKKKKEVSVMDGESRKVMLPQRIGTSRSWDSSREDVRVVSTSKSWDASESGSHGWRKSIVQKKQKNLWEDGNYEESVSEKSPLRQRQFIGGSKSWDYSGVQQSGHRDETEEIPLNDNRQTNGNLEKKQDVSHDDRNSPDANFFQSDPFGTTSNNNGDNVIEDAFASWDGAGAEWVDPADETEEVSSEKAQTKQTEALDWNKKGSKNVISNMIPVEFETPQVSDQVSDYEEDEDSIFAFENATEEKREEAPPPPPANPQDIFAKLNKGLKQAENNKSRMLRGDTLSNADSDFSKEDTSEPTSEKSKTAEKRNVAFVKDKENTIHTYLVEESHFDSRDSNSNVDSTDDEEMEETDPESSVDKEAERSSSPRNQTMVAHPRSVSPKEKIVSMNDRATSPKRSKESVSLLFAACPIVISLPTYRQLISHIVPT
jgi:hypothetical protein